MNTVQVELLCECAVPEGSSAWIAAPLSVLAERVGPFSCTVLLTTEAEIRALNHAYRGCDAVTDVLSFPSREAGQPPEEDLFAGDIAICVAQAGRQAQAIGHSLEREMAFLALHGALHLHGWDHERDAEAEEMYAVQREIMETACSRLESDGC